jgi:hypothetical protein
MMRGIIPYTTLNTDVPVNSISGENHVVKQIAGGGTGVMGVMMSLGGIRGELL